MHLSGYSLRVPTLVMKTLLSRNSMVSKPLLRLHVYTGGNVFNTPCIMLQGCVYRRISLHSSTILQYLCEHYHEYCVKLTWTQEQREEYNNDISYVSVWSGKLGTVQSIHSVLHERLMLWKTQNQSSMPMKPCLCWNKYYIFTFQLLITVIVLPPMITVIMIITILSNEF